MNMKPYPDSIGLDPKADYQGTDHLNILGAEKVSIALGQYLLDNHYVSIGAMKDGSLLESGTFDELMEKKEYFYSLFTVSQK